MRVCPGAAHSEETGGEEGASSVPTRPNPEVTWASTVRGPRPQTARTTEGGDNCSEEGISVTGRLSEPVLWTVAQGPQGESENKAG